MLSMRTLGTFLGLFPVRPSVPPLVAVACTGQCVLVVHMATPPSRAALVGSIHEVSCVAPLVTAGADNVWIGWLGSVLDVGDENGEGVRNEVGEYGGH